MSQMQSRKGKNQIVVVNDLVPGQDSLNISDTKNKNGREDHPRYYEIHEMF